MTKLLTFSIKFLCHVSDSRLDIRLLLLQMLHKHIKLKLRAHITFEFPTIFHFSVVASHLSYSLQLVFKCVDVDATIKVILKTCLGELIILILQC